MPKPSKPKKTKRLEAMALRISAVGYFFMAALGIGFSWSTGSQAILLDGLYSGLSFFMALAAGRVSRLVEVPSTSEYQFGFAHFEPLLNFLRGMMILALGSLAVFSAINALLHGGRPITPGWALVYALGASFICILLAFMQKGFAKKTGSPLLEVDSKNWLVDGVISGATGLAFLAAYLIENTSWQMALPYVDPGLVVCMALVMAKVPLTTVWDNGRQVLALAPPQDVQRKVLAGLDQACQGLDIASRQVRMMRLGRFFYVQIYLEPGKGFKIDSVADLDAMRSQIVQAMPETPGRLIVDVAFTGDMRWSKAMNYDWLKKPQPSKSNSTKA